MCIKHYIIVFLSFLSLSISFEVKAQQRFNVGVKSGINTSQVAGDNYSGFNKVGFVGGIFVRGKLNETWKGQFEIIFSQKGSKHNGDNEKGDFNYYFLGLDYLEVPVLFQYHLKKFTYEIGPGFSFLMKEREYLNFQDLTGIRPFNKKEISFNMGINFIIFDNLGVNWRYTNSLSSIRQHASGASRWYNPGQTNNLLSFTLTYLFGNGKTE